MSAPWLTGGRLSSRVVERHLAGALLHAKHEEAMTRAAGKCVRIWRHAVETLGPASGAGAVWNFLVRPCADALGWTPGDPRDLVLAGVRLRAATAAFGTTRQLLTALPWGTSQEGLGRAMTRLAGTEGAAWASVCNGVSWRWYDATRPYAQDHLGVDLSHATVDARVWHALWLFGQAGRAVSARHAATSAWVDHLLAGSASEAAGTAASLRDGVGSALAALTAHVPAERDRHVTQIFQWLFLLFAEARWLLPAWHPAYGRSYALTALARDARLGSPPPMGLHESLVAIGRVGLDGLDLGQVRVAALNGPLFRDTALAHPSARIPDAVLGRILDGLARGTSAAAWHAPAPAPAPEPAAVPGPAPSAAHATGEPTPDAVDDLRHAVPAARASSRRRTHDGQYIDFAALDVEHLGSLYEHLVSPAADGGPALLRKRTGAFYTPRPLADLLVQRTLGPLVREASSERILSLRVLDPAMGSGALLAGALRYMVGAVEAAWTREGRGGPLDIPASERASLPRRVAEQCLFGVDVNPIAVQVARLSLWLLSLAPDRPLTWLDGHLRVGNSLAGASPSLVLGRPPVREHAARRRVDGQLTLFDLSRWHHEAAEIGPLLRALSARPTDSAQDARDKSDALEALRQRAPLAVWRARADAWCGAAMDSPMPSAAAWRAVDEAIRSGAAGSVSRAIAGLRQRWHELALAQRCLHWPLEFPDVFDAGRGGFDAVIANPPWEMLRGDLGTSEERASQREGVEPLLRFVRRSGVYRVASGHVNSYQLFAERMLQLLRPDGRLGCLLPGSVLADHGSAALRRHLFDRAAVDRVSVLANSDALFPIHRSMRIVCLTGTSGPATEGIVVDGEGFRIGSLGATPQPATPRLLPRALLRRATGASEAIPNLRHVEDLRLLEQVVASPRLGDPGWGLRFGRELNATEDRGLLRAKPEADGALVVLDGKHLHPFAVRAPVDGPWVSEADARGALPSEPWRRWRLAYRDVSSPGNTRSLIAALLPPGCVSTHTIFCVRAPPRLAEQLYLVGMLNSLIADWFVRRYLGSHVTTQMIGSVPVPQVPASDPRRRRLVRLAVLLMRAPDDERAQADLHATAAQLYGLDARALAVVVSDFPRLSAAVRDRLSG